MLFNSIEFAVFLPIVFFGYWFLCRQNRGAQNLLLLAASYVFYGWWDWRFLSLVFISSLVDFLVGRGLDGEERERTRKLLLAVSLIINLGLLGFFKYFNFFIDNFSRAFTLLGQPLEPAHLRIILPVGISFYTFQELSYTLDVYRRKLEPSRHVVEFLVYVSFFPQLVAGPIERASNLLPQFRNSRTFDYAKAVDGMRQILWGLFKKVVVADGCAVYANAIFSGEAGHSGSTLWLGAAFFAFQIYGDFSGYSDIAIGTARLFGFSLMRNFAFPYFSRDIAEFWRRWHISLTTWFRDYVYIPLGGSRGSLGNIVRNTFIVFLVSGFWHGARWTYVAWGFINACYFLPLLLLKRNKVNVDTVAQGRWLPSLAEAMQIILTFLLTLIAWVFFRSDNIHKAHTYISGMFSASLFSIPQILPVATLVFIFILVLAEWLQRGRQHALQLDGLPIPFACRWGIYYAIIAAIFLFGRRAQPFIYFQF